jgi:hypothetical protein
VISKSAGGIGLSIHDIRATGSYIRGTNGASNGIVPMLRVFNDTARYVDQVRPANSPICALGCCLWCCKLVCCPAGTERVLDPKFGANQRGALLLQTAC